MTTAIAKPIKQKTDFGELRALAERQLREMAKKMKEMEGIIEQMSAALGETPPRPSPLDNVHELLKGARDLRVANGRLSALLVAKTFGVSVNELAGWLGRSRQALAKTPDAESLQNDLAFFERVARLRAVVSQDRFLKWLRMPHNLLDDRSPLELLAEGKRQVVVDFVEDLLTGAPA